MDFVDLHSHLIPGIDDGPTSLAETLEVLRAAHGSGVRHMVATPHMFVEPWNHRDPAFIRESFGRMVAALSDHAGRDENRFLKELRLDLGAENYASSELASALADDRVLTLNGTDNLLVEFPLPLPAPAIRAFLDRILDAGRRPVVAHVERYEAFHRRFTQLEGLRAGGCVLQVNAQTLMRPAKDPIRRAMIDLLRTGVVEVIASDVHGPAVRRPALGAVLAVAVGELGEAIARACLRDNPGRILGETSAAGSAARRG